MYRFGFTVTKTISKNTSSYPISLSDIKAKSEYFRQNPSDTSFDSYISNVIVPMVVFDWEKDTKYLLLDQTIQAFVSDLSFINTEQVNMFFDHLNIREFTNFKYYPTTWDYSSAKTEISSSNYFIVPEAGRESALFNIKKSLLPLEFFQIRNNLETNYKAGFEDNNFTSLNSMIKDALSSQAAMVIDSKTGFCQDFYSTIIEETYGNYSLNNQQVVVL